MAWYADRTLDKTEPFFWAAAYDLSLASHPTIYLRHSIAILR